MREGIQVCPQWIIEVPGPAGFDVAIDVDAGVSMGFGGCRLDRGAPSAAGDEEERGLRDLGGQV